MYQRVRKKMLVLIITAILLTHPSVTSTKSIINTGTADDDNIDNQIIDFEVYNDRLNEPWDEEDFKDTHRYTIVNKVNKLSGNNSKDNSSDKQEINITKEYRANNNNRTNSDENNNKTIIIEINNNTEVTSETTPDYRVIPLELLSTTVDPILSIIDSTIEPDLTVIPLSTTQRIDIKIDETVTLPTTEQVKTDDAFFDEFTTESSGSDEAADKTKNSSVEVRNNTIPVNVANGTEIIIDKNNKSTDLRVKSHNVTTEASIRKDNVTEIDEYTTQNTDVIYVTDKQVNSTLITPVNNNTEFNSTHNQTKESNLELNKTGNADTNKIQLDTSKDINTNTTTESQLDSTEEDSPIFTELDEEERDKVPEDYYDAKDVIPTSAPKTDAISVLFGIAGSVVESVVESVAERVVPKSIFDLFKRMQKQNEALEAERLRSREENGGLGQFGRGILKSISSGLKPLSQLMYTAREGGSLDTDLGFLASFPPVVSGVTSVANVANSLVDTFKDKVQAIYPGTVWCGDGHAQQRSSELGLFFFTDTCCREHDACRIYIRAGETRYGLTNTGLFTRSHCSCDASFRACLRRTNSLVSAQIGLTYFNVLSPQCLRRAHPIVKCLRRTRLTGQKCEEYELDYTKPKMWQWFDNESF